MNAVNKIFTTILNSKLVIPIKETEKKINVMTIQSLAK